MVYDRNFENHKSAIDVNTCVDIIHIAEVFGMPQVSPLKNHQTGPTKPVPPRFYVAQVMLVTNVGDEMCWSLLWNVIDHLI